MKKRAIIIFVIMLLLALIFAGCAKSVSPELKTNARAASHGQMEVHFIDVGQADCTLIITGEHAMLIDAGNNEDSERITSYLREQNITKLDFVIGTHPDADHIGSLDTVIAIFEIGEVILPDNTHTTKTFEDVLTVIENKELEITLASPGDTYELGSAEFTMIAPNKNYGDDLNNWSAGLKIVFGSTSFLFTGDAGYDAEQDILENGMDIKSDVFQAGHHGSNTSNSEAFIETADPDYTVISCGKDNSYGHPSPEVLQIFQKHGIRIKRLNNLRPNR